MRQAIAAILVAATLVQSACSPAGDGTAPPTGEDTRATAAALPLPAASAETRIEANDGVAVELAPLTQAEIAAADLHPELGCGFTTPAGALLVAKGIVGANEPARGVVKIAGKVEPIIASNFGYEGMSAEGAFTGRGLVFDVEQRGAPTPDFESQTSDAQLTVLRGGEVERLIDGTWTCGP